MTRRPSRTFDRARTWARGVLAAAALVLAGAAARADDLASFYAAVDAASTHNRVAIYAMRMGDLELASDEITAFRQAWQAVVARNRPAAFDDTKLYVTTMTDVSLRLVAASFLLDAGRVDPARNSLNGVRTALAHLRRSSGVVVLADCVLDANTAMEALAESATQADPSATDTGADVTAKAEAYARELRGCDAMAAADVQRNREFRRLIDGALASLGQMPKAAETRDRDLLHRLLIELRSFDHLLAFRYG